MLHKVVTVAQQKGGAGKSTVTAQLAIAWSMRRLRVAVIDIDPQGSLTHWHKLRSERFGEGYTGITFSTVSGWRIGSEIARLKRNHDVILIDSPPHVETEARTAIRQADLVLVPVQPSPTDLWATKATLDIAMAERVPVKVVLNRVLPNSKLAGAIAGELKHLAKTTLGNRVVFASSLMEGATVLELQPNSPASMEIKGLAEELSAFLKLEELEEEQAALEAPAKGKSRSKEMVPA